MKKLGFIFLMHLCILSKAQDISCHEAIEQGISDLKSTLKATENFEKYFSSIRGSVLEAGYLIDAAELALLSEEHLLMLGPPGNAKTMISDLVLGNMQELVASGDTPLHSSSYYKIQMTPETTMSETHGPFDYMELTETGRYERLLDEGMIKYRNVFIDEIFDARPNSLRNLLQALAERAHAQGSHITPGRIETVFGTSNHYLSQVYEKAKDDRPKAVIDRFAFVSFVPSEFELIDSYSALIRGAKKNHSDIPKLDFDDLEKVRALLKKVDISLPVAQFLALLHTELKKQTEKIEAADLKRVREAKRNGEDPTPTYRSTKFYSKRTLGKAASALKAIVVRDWMKKRGQRDLSASFEDLKQLEKFYALGGPEDEVVQSQFDSATKMDEKAQLETILSERKLFREAYDTIINESNAVVVNYDLVDVQSMVDSKRTKPETERLKILLLKHLVDSLEQTIPAPRQHELKGLHIGYGFIKEFCLDGLNKILSGEEGIEIKKLTSQKEINKLKALLEEAVREVEAQAPQVVTSTPQIESIESDTVISAPVDAVPPVETISSEKSDFTSQPISTVSLGSIDMPINAELDQSKFISIAPDGKGVLFTLANYLTATIEKSHVSINLGRRAGINANDIKGIQALSVSSKMSRVLLWDDHLKALSFDPGNVFGPNVLSDKENPLWHRHFSVSDSGNVFVLENNATIKIFYSSGNEMKIPLAGDPIAGIVHYFHVDESKNQATVVVEKRGFSTFYKVDLKTGRVWAWHRGHPRYYLSYAYLGYRGTELIVYRINASKSFEVLTVEMASITSDMVFRTYSPSIQIEGNIESHVLSQNGKYIYLAVEGKGLLEVEVPKKEGFTAEPKIITSNRVRSLTKLIDGSIAFVEKINTAWRLRNIPNGVKQQNEEPSKYSETTEEVLKYVEEEYTETITEQHIRTEERTRIVREGGGKPPIRETYQVEVPYTVEKEITKTRMVPVTYTREVPVGSQANAENPQSFKSFSEIYQKAGANESIDVRKNTTDRVQPDGTVVQVVQNQNSVQIHLPVKDSHGFFYRKWEVDPETKTAVGFATSGAVSIVDRHTTKHLSSKNAQEVAFLSAGRALLRWTDQIYPVHLASQLERFINPIGNFNVQLGGGLGAETTTLCSSPHNSGATWAMDWMQKKITLVWDDLTHSIFNMASTQGTDAMEMIATSALNGHARVQVIDDAHGFVVLENRPNLHFYKISLSSGNALFEKVGHFELANLLQVSFVWAGSEIRGFYSYKNSAGQIRVGTLSSSEWDKQNLVSSLDLSSLPKPVFNTNGSVAVAEANEGLVLLDWNSKTISELSVPQASQKGVLREPRFLKGGKLGYIERLYDDNGVEQKQDIFHIVDFAKKENGASGGNRE